MDVEAVETRPEDVEADVLGFAVADPVELSPHAQRLDEAIRGRLRHLVEDGELRGELARVTLVHAVDELPAHRVAAVGVGERARVDVDALRTAAAQAAGRVGDIGGGTLAWMLEDEAFALPAAEQARAVVEGAALGQYQTGRWKSGNGRAAANGGVERIVLCGPGAQEASDEARRAAVVAAWTNSCRDLVNAPPNEITPDGLAAYARDLAARLDVRFHALGPEEIAEARMEAFMAVARGSAAPPRLIELAYEPEEARDDVLLAYVGKAITFDSGGLSLKPPESMDDMKSDMGGGAAVLAALGAIAELEIPVRVRAIVPSCENMPGGRALRPGDIVRASNGKTIEVNNTDAEGRLILADALPYARAAGATHLVDLATLTGTMRVAMGDFYAGLFGNDVDWIDAVAAAGEASGDRVWRWPLHESYFRFLESPFADVKNRPEKERGSSIIAARFLQEFAGEGPWAHLDIAGTAYLDRGRDYYRQVGATGFGVRLLTELAARTASAA